MRVFSEEMYFNFIGEVFLYSFFFQGYLWLHMRVSWSISVRRDRIHVRALLFLPRLAYIDRTSEPLSPQGLFLFKIGAFSVKWSISISLQIVLSSGVNRQNIHSTFSRPILFCIFQALRSWLYSIMSMDYVMTPCLNWARIKQISP
jgi:hypothetical protein